MNDFIKLDKAPTLQLHYPTCSACTIELEHTGDNWLCPSCGTSWSLSDGDDEPGELYESWSGEHLDGPTLNEDQAAEWGGYIERKYRHETWPSIYPTRPTPPIFGEAR